MTRRQLIIVIGLLGTFAAATPLTAAECDGFTLLGRVKGEVGNPFTAEVYTTVATTSTQPIVYKERRIDTVARDAEGRVRVDSYPFSVLVVRNKVVKDVERHDIWICDPVAGEVTSLYPDSKTATVHKASPLVFTDHYPVPAFCDVQLHRGPAALPNRELEDLGHQVIEGVDAIGVRERRTFTSGSSDTKIWCSEELGTMVLQDMATRDEPNAFHTAMRNIERVDPDSSLFVVPPDYKIVDDPPLSEKPTKPESSVERRYR